MCAHICMHIYTYIWLSVYIPAFKMTVGKNYPLPFLFFTLKNIDPKIGQSEFKSYLQ